MASESPSFRISRSAEGLAETVALLSQRLVALEQRLGLLERQVQNQLMPQPEELASLRTVETLLADCRALLETPLENPSADPGDPT